MTCEPQAITKHKTYTIVNDYRTIANANKTEILVHRTRMDTVYMYHSYYYYYVRSIDRIYQTSSSPSFLSCRSDCLIGRRTKVCVAFPWKCVAANFGNLYAMMSSSSSGSGRCIFARSMSPSWNALPMPFSRSCTHERHNNAIIQGGPKQANELIPCLVVFVVGIRFWLIRKYNVIIIYYVVAIVYCALLSDSMLPLWWINTNI